MRSRALIAITAGLMTASWALGPAVPGASALNAQPLCTAAGLVSGLAGKACTLATHARTIAKAGKKVLGGHLVGAAKTVLGEGGSSPSTTTTASSASTASTALGLAAIGAWVLGGATIALHETARVLSDTTSPQLSSTWFSAAYWRIAAIAAVLTLPFLFAAAIQALLRSDLALLARAALGYLPLSLLAVGIAAPVTMLLLAASDELSAIVGSAAGNADTRLLTESSAALATLTVLSGSPFLAFLVGLFTAAGALALWLELLMREAAVYVIVLMLPLVFASFVWPARRVWAIRAVELLVALILSKFAIVAVLALGGEALSHGAGHFSLTGSLAGLVLLLMGVFAPWALLRLVPLAELASGAAGSLRAESRATRGPASTAASKAGWADDLWRNGWVADLTSLMRRQAEAMPSPGPAPAGGGRDRASLAELASPGRRDTGPSADGDPFGGPNPDRGGPEGDGDPGGGGPEGDGDPGGGGPEGDGAPEDDVPGAELPASSVGVGGGPGNGVPGDGLPASGVRSGGGGTGGNTAGIYTGQGDGEVADDDDGSRRRERFRDWGEMWQAEDEQWRPFVYPFDHESPPDPPWPPDGGRGLDRDAGGSVGAGGEPPTPGSTGAQARASHFDQPRPLGSLPIGEQPGIAPPGRTADEQQPHAPEQPPEDGWL